MKRRDLTDEEWARLEPLLPSTKPRRGGRWTDHRIVINGNFFRIRAGLKRGSAGGRPPAFDPERYKERNTVERCVNKLKNFRAVATRYDKRELIYQGTIDVASIRIWLRDPMK